MRAVLADPDADLPRLVLADWLEENGDADRAEFIRVQCRLAELDWRRWPAGAEVYAGERDALYRRRNALWESHRAEWRAELPKYARPLAQFERGFVGEWCGRTDDLRKLSGRVWDAHPIRAMDIRLGSYGPADITGLLARPRTERVRRLALRGVLLGQEAAELAESRHLSCVTAMTVTGATDEGCIALGLCPSLGNLRELHLGGGPDLAPDALAEFADSPTAGGLTSLWLEAHFLRGEAAWVVAGSPRLRGLKLLGVNGAIGDGGARALLAGEHLGGLECLVVRDYDTIPDHLHAALAERFGSAYCRLGLGEYG